MTPLERAARAVMYELTGECEPGDAAPGWDEARNIARAVIEAIREPDEGMVEAASDVTDGYARGVWKDMIETTTHFDVTSAFKGVEVTGTEIEPSVLLTWPNALGQTPGDTLGREVRVEASDEVRWYSVDGYEGDRLYLKDTTRWHDAALAEGE